MTGTPAEAVVIGASAGALEALSVILPALPAKYRLPVTFVVCNNAQYQILKIGARQLE